VRVAVVRNAIDDAGAAVAAMLDGAAQGGHDMTRAPAGALGVGGA
jgi:hypothetical protein